MNTQIKNQTPEYFELVKKYESEGKCIAHFNVSNLDQLRAICEVAQDMDEPVIIGASEGEREYIGVDMLRKMVDQMKTEYAVQIYLNADHTYTFEKVVEVVLAGYDSVIVDGAKLEYEENINLVKMCTDWVRIYEKEKTLEVGYQVKVLVEAELGYIGQSSSLNESLPAGVSEENLTTVEQAIDFVTRTGIDMFAPAAGNVHGMLVNAKEPDLNIQRIKDLRQALPNTPFVLHGASGNSDEDLVNSIDAGVSIIHINTEIRKAFTDGVRSYLNDEKNKKEIAPYKYGKAGQEEMKKVVRAKMELYVK